MKKISINRDDLEEMVFQGVKKILKEGIGNMNYEDTVLDWDDIFSAEAFDYLAEELDELLSGNAEDSDLKVRVYYTIEEDYSDMSPYAHKEEYPSYHHFEMLNPLMKQEMEKNPKIGQIVTDSIDNYLEEHIDEIIGEVSNRYEPDPDTAWKESQIRKYQNR